MNERALAALGSERHLHFVPGAGHLFEESGTLDEVVHHARDGFRHHLGSAVAGRP